METLKTQEFKKPDPGHIHLPKGNDGQGKRRLQGVLGRGLFPVVLGYLRAGIGTGKQDYHKDHPIDVFISGNICLSCLMSLGGDLTDPVGNAITWVFGSVRGLAKLFPFNVDQFERCSRPGHHPMQSTEEEYTSKLWVVRTLMFEEGTLGCLRHRTLLSFYRSYGFWRSKVHLSDIAFAATKEAQQSFAQAWENTGWVPRTWVHRAACNPVILSGYSNLYIFSITSTEKGNSAFKLELGHLLCGWSIMRPIYTKRGLLHLLNNHSLDLGLLLRKA